MTSRQEDGVVDAAADLHDMIDGYWRSQVLCAAARLGIADLLAGGPLTVDEMAAECDVPRATLARLLRALVGLGVCTHGPEGHRTTALGRALESTAPGGAHDRALQTADLFYPMWADLTDCVCLDGSAADVRAGWAPVDAPGGPDDLSALVGRTLDEQGMREARSVVQTYDVPTGAVLVAVGGSTDPLLTELLRAHPDCRGVLCDLPGGASQPVEVPRGDVYLLSFLLHDRDDEDAVALLRSVRRAMCPGARLIVVEQLLPPENGRDAALADLHMLVMTGGRERTEVEYAALLAAAGLRHTGTVRTGGRRSVVEARPA